MKLLKRIAAESLVCLLAIAVFQTFWNSHLSAQDALPPIDAVRFDSDQYKTVEFVRPMAGADAWLIVRNRGSNGWEPESVVVVTDYTPIVKKLGPNKYEITFTPEAAP